ncbi:MAG: hypothetical protein HOI15_09085 [Opitutales bacterium]|nr:hypothetical protein [Opitutales bacterium]
MDNRLRSVNAQLPIVNSDYDPNAPPPGPCCPGGRGQGRPGGPRGGQGRAPNTAN